MNLIVIGAIILLLVACEDTTTYGACLEFCAARDSGVCLYQGGPEDSACACFGNPSCPKQTVR
jgi:hypothetical protein